VDVEGSSVLSGCRDESRRHVPDRQFIAKIEKAKRDLDAANASIFRIVG